MRSLYDSAAASLSKGVEPDKPLRYLCPGGNVKSAVLAFAMMLWSSQLNVPGLVEVPARISRGDTMAILYTGDGGWRTTDKGIARILSDNGIPVVGINTLRYFWTRRTPEKSAEDFARIVLHYQAAWKKRRIIAIGYSFGADALPFMLARTARPLLERVDLLALLAPTKTVDFEFHVKQWFSEEPLPGSVPVLPEIKKLKGIKIISFCGALDGEALCRDLPPGFRRVFLPRIGHRFDSVYPMIAADILRALAPQK